MNAIMQYLRRNESVDESLMEKANGAWKVEQVKTDTTLNYTEQNHTHYLHWKKFYKHSSLDELLVEVMSKKGDAGHYHFDAQLKRVKSETQTGSRFHWKSSLLEMGESLLRQITITGKVKNADSLEVQYLVLVDTKKNICTAISHGSLTEFGFI